MMTSKILNLLKKTKGIVILVENEKPSYVVMPFSEYEKILEEKPVSQGSDLTPEVSEKNDAEYALLDKINRDIEIWKTAQKEKEKDLSQVSQDDPEDIKIEEIPY